MEAERETPRSSGGRSFDDPPPAPPSGGGGSWGGEEVPEPNQAGAIAVAAPIAIGAAAADGPLPIGDAIGLGILAGAGIYAGYQYFTRDDGPSNGVSQSQIASIGFTGEPGSTVTVNNPDGTPRQTRTYGEDGYPVKDIDYNHDHGQGQPHVHDWGRPEDGGPPTHEDRQPGRPPREGEVE